MQLKFDKKHHIFVLNVFFVLTLLSSCQNSNDNNQVKENECLDNYFYLVKDKYGNTNSQGNVLLHLSNEDSILVNPEKICSLHMRPIWEKSEFPEEVLNFSNLKYLWIAMRNFKELPSEITQLKELKHLDLQNSGLRRLPENIGELKNLEELTLLFSNVEILPLSICELSNLRKIHLGATKITKLPTCFNQLKNLEEFILFYEDDIKISQELKLQLEELQKQLANCNFVLN